MAKFIIFVVFLAALVAVSVASSEATHGHGWRFRDIQCQREVQENPLEACRQVVDRQLTGRSRVVSIPFQSGLRMRCCQQLQDISDECRCAAIRQMVRDYEQTMAPLEERYPGETAEQWRRQEEGEGFYGETAERRQEGEGFYGEEAARRQPSGEFYGEREQRQEEEEGRYGQTEDIYRRGEQQTTRVKLSKVRQYVSRLPTMCQIEPQECSVFFPGQY